MYSSVMSRGHRNYMGQNEHLTNDLEFSPSREGSSQWIGKVKWELGPNTKNTGI